jgi:hypothetical protein
MTSLPKDYLQKEYELRLSYLKDHLTRMWTRFNFFLIINTGLFAVVLNQNSRQDFVVLVITLGLIVSILWNQFAATDNYLVDVYRRQIKHAHFLLTRDTSFDALREDPRPIELKDWAYTGNTSAEYFDPEDGQEKRIPQNFFQRRFSWLSATELGVVMSFLYILAWLGLLIVKIRGVAPSA